MLHDFHVSSNLLDLFPTCSIANMPPAVFGAFSGAICLHASSALFAAVSTSRQKVRHRLRLCVQQERHVPLIHKGEVILELETELESNLLLIVVLDRFRSKLQDFCDVCRRPITAPPSCARFACSLTQSTTTQFQHNDIMMKTTVQNDL